MKMVSSLCFAFCLASGLTAETCAAHARSPRVVNLTPPDMTVMTSNRDQSRSASRGRARHHFATPFDGRLAATVAAPADFQARAGVGSLEHVVFRGVGPWHQDIQEGYRDMSESVSRRVWQDPKGRRIVFDLKGKPGLAVEIPLH